MIFGTEFSENQSNPLTFKPWSFSILQQMIIKNVSI